MVKKKVKTTKDVEFKWRRERERKMQGIVYMGRRNWQEGEVSGQRSPNYLSLFG